MPQSNEDEFSLKSLFVPLTTFKALHLILVIGLVVFANMLFNEFVADDKLYIINNLQTHIVNVGSWFGVNAFNTVGQYRPVPAAYFSLLYSMFTTNAFFYHFVQILLHIVCVGFVYIFFRKFLTPWIAFFVTVAFLIHPMNVESVSYIAQSVNPIFFLFGIIPLVLLLKEKVTNKLFAVILVSFFLTLLTKETGILFIFVAVLYAWLFKKKYFSKLFIGSLITFVIYLCIRFFIGQVGLADRPLAPIADATLAERFMTLPLILFYYVKTFFYPMELSYMQHWVITSIDFQTFIFPLIVDTVFFSVVIGFANFLFKNENKYFKPWLFFLTWFIIGLFFHANIFPLDMTVGDRWFYFTMIGMLGMLGIASTYLLTRFPSLKHIAVLFAIMVLILFGTRTMIRNTDWQNGIILHTQDSLVSNNFAVENSLGAEYGSRKGYEQARIHYLKSISFRPNEINLLNLAIVYSETEKPKEAKVYFEKALKAKSYNAFYPHKHQINTYKGYASMMIFYENTPVPTDFMRAAVKDYPNDSELWLLFALSEYKQNNKQVALNAANKAHQLNPHNAFLVNNIKNNEPIKMNIQKRTFIIEGN